MTILKNCEIYFPTFDPKRPNTKFDKENPTWGCQIRTTSKEQKNAWIAEGLTVTTVVPDDDAQPYFKVNLKRKTKNKKGEPMEPVKVVNGALEEIDPRTIGNGSVGNIQIFQYEYKKADGSTGISTLLSRVQITKHVVFTPRPGEQFEMTDTEVVNQDGDDSDDEEFEKAPPSPSVGKKAQNAF